MLTRRIAETASGGVEHHIRQQGEPLLYRHIGEIIVQTQKAGIDVALTSNAVALKEQLMHEARCRKPRACLIWPNTGSTISFHRA